MATTLDDAIVTVMGAGTMGTGIAQVAAQAGHRVQLFDLRAGAAEAALTRLRTTMAGLVAKGRMTEISARNALDRLQPIGALEQAAASGIVIESIVEDMDAKRALLAQLEGIVPPQTVLASNTSSLSITAMANGLQHPGRVVGMHFFNPVPLMKLVEVVRGLRTDPGVAGAVRALAQRWGKVAVHARSTPGFIVNRIARPFYAEALALLTERALSPAVLDECMRGAGFRMGPCEVMDMIGHDVNFAVTRSVFDANFGDARYQPSLLQKEMVDGGLLGRKAGRGFFDYPDGTVPPPPARDAAEPTPPPPATRLVVVGGDRLAQRLCDALDSHAIGFGRRDEDPWVGLQVGDAQLRITDGRPATQIAVEEGVRDVAVCDLPLGEPGGALAWSVATGASEAWKDAVGAWLRALGWQPTRVQDSAGLPVARTVAMLINEACDAVLQGVCTPEDANQSMRLGVNYPAGPFEWLAKWNARAVVQLIENLDACYRGERYRVSPELRRRAWIEATMRPSGL